MMDSVERGARAISTSLCEDPDGTQFVPMDISGPIELKNWVVHKQFAKAVIKAIEPELWNEALDAAAEAVEDEDIGALCREDCRFSFTEAIKKLHKP